VDTEHFDDPVAAYDRLAPRYAAFADRRGTYLRAVEDLIVSRLPVAANLLLDVGSGDGSRATRIAASAGIRRIVLIEPSSRMSRQVPSAAELWSLRAEDLDPNAIVERFDVITCLWNSLGHVPGDQNRRRALSSMAQLLSPAGKLFLDVNNRYNALSYGFSTSCGRWIKDLVLRDPRNGDVTASWRVGESRVSTYGHVFTHQEVMQLARSSGLDFEARIVVDYENGALRRLPWLGNLLYTFRRNSRMDSSSAPATS
jgi:SAM-dependent methyltransferase